MSAHLRTLVERYSALRECQPAIQAAFDLLTATFGKDGKLLLCGNGGSTADSEHWAGELLKGSAHSRPHAASMRGGLPPEMPARLQWAFPVDPLTGFPGFASPFGNDVDPEYAFAQLVLAPGRTGDSLGALSASGNASNVCRAAEVTRARSIPVLALTGKSGGNSKNCRMSVFRRHPRKRCTFRSFIFPFTTVSR